MSDDEANANNEGRPAVGAPVEPSFRPPARALRLTLALEADTPEDMATALHNLAHRVERDEVTEGCWGGPSDGAIYEMLVDPDMTHDVYHQKLREYLDSMPKRQLGITGGMPMDYDEELHKAWVTKALHLAMEYREAEPGREVRDAMRDMKSHFEGRPASMPTQDTVADDMDEVAKQYAHKLAMNLECLVLECPPSARFFDEANTTLGEYRSAMNKIHERECQTHMGEPLLKGERSRVRDA